MPISRRETITGAGLLACCLAFAPITFAKSDTTLDESLVDTVEGLSDEDLFELELLVAAEKHKRDVEAVPIPSGYYIAGTDIDPGSYLITAFSNRQTQKEDEDVCRILTYLAGVPYEESGLRPWDDNARLMDGESHRVILEEGDMLEIDSYYSDCIIAKAQKLSL